MSKSNPELLLDIINNDILIKCMDILLGLGKYGSVTGTYNRCGW